MFVTAVAETFMGVAGAVYAVNSSLIDPPPIEFVAYTVNTYDVLAVKPGIEVIVPVTTKGFINDVDDTV